MATRFQAESNSRGLLPEGARRALILIAIPAAIALAYWPGLSGFWGRDDFMQLATVRLIGTPWPLFVGDHYFPVPGSIFRPLGFASFWLWESVFGENYRAHALGDLLLHIAVAVSLYRVIRVGGLERPLALLCTLLFALHPAVLGTALWWSARFDLLATLFALAAIRAAFDYAERTRVASLASTLAAVLAALLSKEIAAAAVIAIALVWVRWVRRDSAHRLVAFRALALLGAVAIGFFLWRWIVLGTPSSGLVGDTPMTAAICKGVLDWLTHLFGYLSFWARLDVPLRVATVVAAISLCCVAFAAFARASAKSAAPREIDLLLCGLMLFLIPALLQAPVTALNSAPLGADASAIEAAMQSRLYYFSIAGLVIAFSSIAHRAVSEGAAGLRRPILLALCVPVIAFGFASRQLAAGYAQRSSEPKAMVEALMRSVDRLALPSKHCRVFVLGIKPPPEWSVYVSPDSIVKALAPDLDRVDHCFFEADYPTYFHLTGSGTTAADALPYRPREAHGKTLPWLAMGDAVVAYLDPPEDSSMIYSGALILRYDGSEFRDATSETTRH